MIRGFIDMKQQFELSASVTLDLKHTVYIYISPTSVLHVGILLFM